MLEISPGTDNENRSMITPSIKRNALLTLSLLLIPTLAHAHVGIGETNGFLNGTGHPLNGIDHICAMVAVGLWASQMGGRSLWLVPLTFLMVMATGGLLGMSGVTLPFVEQHHSLRSDSGRLYRRGHTSAPCGQRGPRRPVRFVPRPCPRCGNAPFGLRASIRLGICPCNHHFSHARDRPRSRHAKAGKANGCALRGSGNHLLRCLSLTGREPDGP